MNDINIKVKIKYKNLHWLLLFILFICSCEIITPEDVTEEYKIFYVPEYVVKTIEIPPPMLESSDSIAQMVVDFLKIYNDTEQYIDLFSFKGVDSVDYNSAQEWIKKIQTTENTEITVTLLVEKDIYMADTHYNCTWDVKISGRDTLTDIYYDNWRSVTANMWNGEQTILRLNGKNSTDIIYRIYWGSYSVSHDNYEIQCFKGDSVTNIIQIVTGSRNLFFNRVDTVGRGVEHFTWIEYSVRWFSAGHGEWTQYTESGEEVASGNW